MERLIGDTLKQRIVISDLQRRLNDAVGEAKIVLKTLRALKKDVFSIARQPLEKIEIRLDLPIQDLEFSVRTYNCLRKGGYNYKTGMHIPDINTLGRLLDCAEEDLIMIRNFGTVSLKEVQDRLAELGLNLKSSA